MSIVHSMVEYIDGSVVAQLGVSDMRGPISYAMGHPDRLKLDLPPLDLARLGRLTFEPPDPARFPAFTLAYRALELGGTAPAVLSGADEAAVAAFLARRCRFTEIAEVCAAALDAHTPEPVRSVEQALAASDWGRREAERRVGRSAG
jgi:1-deoxy-D-xylulose-5-phosphate reductoisomerase